MTKPKLLALAVLYFVLLAILGQGYTNPLLSVESFFAYPVYLYRSNFTAHAQPLIKPSNRYTIVLVGDSMTAFLGDSSDLKNYLKRYYPHKKIEVLNYGFGSSNVLSVEERLTTQTNHAGETFTPILEQDFDLLLIESFGHNPLSQFSLEEGLIKQTEALDKIIRTIKSKKPRAVIVLVATIAPNKKRYAEGVVVLMPEQREAWANERITYLKNHIDYANKLKLPLVNIYQKSLTSQGDGHLDYISGVDFIHPSSTGILLISSEIANYIFDNRLLPL